MFEWRWISWDWNILKHFVKRLAWHYGTLPIEGLPRVWASKPRATSFLDVLAAPQAASMLSRKSPHVTYVTWSTWYRNVEGCRGCRGCDLNLEPSLLCSLDHLDLLGLCQVLLVVSFTIFQLCFLIFLALKLYRKIWKATCFAASSEFQCIQTMDVRIVGSSWCCCAICGFNNVTKERTWRQKP